MRKFLAFGVCAAVSVLASELAVAEDVKTPKSAPNGAETPKPGMDKPKPSDGASRGGTSVAPASEADTAGDAQARRLREEDERKATESKEKMKKRPGYKEDVPGPRARSFGSDA